MKRSYLFTLIICLGITVLQAQKLPSKVKTGLPKVFDDYQHEDKVRDIIATRTFMKNGTRSIFWKVYSDCDNNPTYDKPNSTSTKSELQFMDEVKVAEVVDNWLHVYTDEDQKYPVISSKAKDKGWIPIERLVVSQRCMYANERFVTSKAMILANLESLQSSKNFQFSKEFYNDPDFKDKSQYVARNYDIYFVFKKTDDAVLLSKTDVISDDLEERKNSVLGWMKRSSVTFWNHRVSMELNWTDSAYSEYKRTPIGVFSSQQQASSFHITGDSSGAFRIRYMESKRDSGFVKRLPVLDNLPGSIKKVGTIADMTANDEKELARLQEKLQSVIDVIENVNILFVIDGSENMAPYYKSITDGIASFMSKEAKRSNNRIRFGAAIFRDYNSDGSIQMEKLTTDYSTVTGFLSKVECYNNSKSNFAPALYNGLIKGIDGAGFLRNQSNFIILIGNKANPAKDARDINVQDVIRRLAQYQISLVGFQAFSRGIMEGIAFNKGINALVMGTATMLSDNPTDTDRFRWDPLQQENADVNSFILKYKDEGKISDQQDLMPFGSFSGPGGEGQFGIELLEEAIGKTISNYNSRVNKQKAIIENSLYRPAKDWTPTLEDKLSQMGFSAAQILNLKKFRAVMVTGYTSDSIMGKRNPCYLPVAFLSEVEIDQILDIAESLNSPLTASERRKSLQETIIGKCQIVLGDRSSNTKELILNYKMNKVWDILFGIPYSDPEIGNIKIKHITSKIYFSDKKVEEFSAKIKTSMKRLQRIKNTVYPYSFKSIDQRYYWVPLDQLP